MRNRKYNGLGLRRQDVVWLVLYTTFLIVDIFFIHQDLDSYRWFSKPALMLTLLIVLWRTADYEFKYAFRLHFLAVFLSWVGDIFLLTDLFLTGLVAFLWAHICYIALMVDLGVRLKGVRFWVRSILTILVAIAVGYYIGRHHPDFQWSIMAYTLIILIMFQFSTLLQPFAPVIIAGAIFFVISDFLLAYGRFIPPFDWHLLAEWKSEAVMFTYGMAQLLLLVGFRKLGRAPSPFSS